MATSYYEEDSTGMPRLVKAPAPTPLDVPTFGGTEGTPAGMINRAAVPAPAPSVVSKPAPTGGIIQQAAAPAPSPWGGIQNEPANVRPPAPAPVVSKPAPVAAPKPPPAAPPIPGGNAGVPGASNFGGGFQAVGGALGGADAMQQGWDSYWATSQPGSMPFAGGTLTRNANGTATFTNANGRVVNYSRNTSFAELASRSPEIAAQWQKDFGYGPMASAGAGIGGVQNTPGTISAPGGVAGAPGAAGAPGSAASGLPAAAPSLPPVGALSSNSASSVNGGNFREWNVTAPQTVQQQASNIIAADSPLMQQARGRAMQQMNERGLINSSLGIQAAQDAVMERALQIAAPDAATNAQAAQFNANQGNAWNLAQQEIRQRDQQFAADMEYKRWALSQNFENEKQLREVEMKYRGELESDSGFQRQYNTYIDGIFQIDMNKDLDPETKLQMKQQLGQQLDDYVTINRLGINMDFSDYWAAKAPPAPAPGAAPAPAPGDVTRNFDLP